MKLLARLFAPILMLASLLAFPVMLLAQEVLDQPRVEVASGVPLLAIIAIGTSILGLLAGVMQWLPANTHTIVNTIVLTGNALMLSFKELAETNPNATWISLGVAALGVIISRFRTKDPVSGEKGWSA